MLRARQYGYTFGHFIRINSKRLLVILAVLVVCAWLTLMIRDYAAYYVVLGLAIGTVCRDLAWFRSNRATWSFTEKTTDWQKVEQLAKDDPGHDTPVGKADHHTFLI